MRGWDDCERSYNEVRQLFNDFSQWRHKKSVHRILKQVRFHPYKMHLVQELNEDDPNRRVDFCETMMLQINDNPAFVSNIVFSDEATFQLNGHVNRHNCRFWFRENPHWMLEAHTQYPAKLNVWAGIINNTLVVHFYSGQFNSRYIRSNVEK
ncbi:hypothetical protein X777_08646 [Ooceraea biroi]|uniref:Uncharacterized protein n=1 Tax=Ooceraea biroi TaxID=2015173 RepID=A0A026W8U2_OOCBI|nr:hypothetical protein X777_08646 [Ooceraea biroi]